MPSGHTIQEPQLKFIELEERKNELSQQNNQIDLGSRNGLESKLYRTREDYLKDRVEHKINRYISKATRYRLAYWAMASTAAVGSAAVPVLVNTTVSKVITTVVSLLVVISVGLQSVFRPREHWRSYDLISSVLREEEMQYSTGTGPYKISKRQDNSDAFQKFVERVEDAIAKERSETIVMRTSAPEAVADKGKENAIGS